jgi:hypothetical protein
MGKSSRSARLPFAAGWTVLDPVLPFLVGPRNGREARESGLSAKGVSCASSHGGGRSTIVQPRSAMALQGWSSWRHL